MAEAFNFEIGIQVAGHEEASGNLDGIIGQVATLTQGVEDFNAATGMSAIAASASDLNNSLVNIDALLSDIDAASAGGISLELGSFEVFDNMLGALTTSSEHLAGIRGDSEGVATIIGDHLSAISADLGEGVDLIHQLLGSGGGGGGRGGGGEGGDGVDPAAAAGGAGDTGAIEELRKKLDEVTESVKGAGDAAADSKDDGEKALATWGEAASEAKTQICDFAHGAINAFDDISGGAIDLVGDIIDIGSAITQFALHPAFELERASHRLGVTLGDDSYAKKFTKNVSDVATTTGFAEHEVTMLAQSLGEVGHSQEALNKEDLTFFANLQGNLGFSIDEIHKFSAASHLMHGSMQEMTAAAMTFEKSFKIPGLVKQLPAITQTAIKSQAMFGKSVVGNAKKSSVAVTRMAGSFAKALGKTAAEAAEDAMQAFSKFAGETRSFQNVFLGLSDSFTPLQMAFLETGMGLSDMQDLLKQGQTDQMGFVKNIKGMTAGMGEFQKQRFMEQLRQDLPEATLMLLNMSDADLERQQRANEAAKAEEARVAKQGKQLGLISGEFDKLRDNIADKFAKSAEQISGMINRVVRLFGGPMSNAFDKFLNYIDQFIPAFDKTEKALKPMMDKSSMLSKILGDLGGSTMGVVAGLGALGTGALFAWKFIRPLWTGLKTGGKLLWNLSKGFGKVIGGLNKVGGKVPFLTKIFGGAIGKLLVIPGLIVAGIKPAIKMIGKISDTLKGEGSGFEKFKDIVGSVLTATWETIDNFLMGLPGKFVEGFSGMGAKISTEGAANLGKDIGKMLGKVIVVFGEWMDSDASPWFSDTFIPFLKNWFTIENMKDVWSGIFDGFAAIAGQVIAFAKGAAEGILEQFGYGFDALPILGQIAFNRLAEFFMVGVDKLWIDMVYGLKKAWAGLDAGTLWDDFAFGLKMFVKKTPIFISEMLAKLTKSIGDWMAGMAENSTFFRKMFGDGASLKAMSATYDSFAKKKAAAFKVEEKKLRDELESDGRKRREREAKESIEKLDKEKARELKKIDDYAKKHYKFAEDREKLEKKLRDKRIKDSPKTKTGPIANQPGSGAGAVADAATSSKSAGAVADSAVSDTQMKEMRGALEGLLNSIKLMGGQAASGPAAEAARAAARNIMIKMAPTGQAGTLLERALKEISIKEVNKS